MTQILTKAGQDYIDAQRFHVIATTTNGVKVRYEARPRRYCEELAERRLIPQSYIDRVDVVACKGDGCYECACLASR